MDSESLFQIDDQKSRCWWCKDHSDYINYHDDEWGHPVDDDHRLFEKICLEGFQSGLSWLTILRKRENFREAFLDFNFHKVAQFNDSHVTRLLQNAGIVRHKGKIAATINNAQKAIEMEREFGSLAAWFWQYEPQDLPQLKSRSDAMQRTTCDTAVEMSRHLKKRGWKFVGPTTAYAFMQAMGMVNDHLTGCSAFQDIENSRKQFSRPGICP